MKQKLLSTCLFALLQIACAFHCQAQQMFRFRYLFTTEQFKSPHLTIKSKSKTPTREQTGYFLDNSGSKQPIYKDNFESTYTPYALTQDRYGSITERQGDTLTIKFWYLVSNKDNDDSSYKDEEFRYIVQEEDWEGTFIGGYKHIKIPFRYTMATATSLPFRTRFDQKGIQSDFLNFNLAIFQVSGKTKFYKADFIEPRNTSFGWGPFLGATTLEDKETEVKRFGLTGGLTGMVTVYNLNLVLGLGIEQGFTSKTNTPTPYVGLGFGFKLLDLSDPVVKSDD